jgi:ABC-type lipopolysaccharide export system ATPase subunit
VLLDEPFSYLAPILVERLKEIIVAEKKRKGIVITDHLYRDILDITDHLYLIQDGKSHVVRGPDELRLLGYLI